jgi:hypothetical protein
VAEIIRKTESTFTGPWLLDGAALAELDEIIDEQSSRLETHRKRQIAKAVRRERESLRKSVSNPEHSADQRKLEDKEIRQRVENYYPSVVRTITLTLSSGDKIRANSFRDALADMHCKDHEVTKVEVGLCCANIRSDLVVPTWDRNHGLSLVTLPEGSEQATELFVKLNMWSEQRRPDLFRRLHGLGVGNIGLLFFLSLACLFVIAMIAGSLSAKNRWKAEVRELVAKGVKPEDHGRALKLLLEQAADPSNAGDLIRLPRWFYVATVATSVVAILLMAYPARTAFEIGKGAASVQRQKWYDSFLRKAIPGFLIMGVIASMLGSFAFDLLRSG